MDATLLAFVALFCRWRGRAAPALPPRAWGLVGEEVRGGPPQTLARRLRSRGVPEAAVLLEDRGLASESAARVDRLAEEGWRPSTPFSPTFPRRLALTLGAACPPVLWVKNEAPELAGQAVGIVGSRSLRPDEAHFAAEAGEEASRMGFALFSGGARGTDRRAVAGAVGAGGFGAHFLPGGSPRRLPAGGALLSLDPEAPPFDRIAALQRNRWIYAASRTVVIVSSRFGTGGSWAGAIEAKRSRLTPLIVFMADPPSLGNEALWRLGAAGVRNVDQLRQAILRATCDPVRLAI
ncbi:MAG: DNA-processing protein DprA [Armatimonadetes bacterium]|nr:DNA-processing protein DprA [Armatimonadota bacterium]